jgi:site-specific recombinase XerD
MSGSQMELISYQLKEFEYRTPEPCIDENGEIQISYTDESPIRVPSITFLYLVDFDENGEMLSASGVDVANAYLLNLILNDSMKDVSLQSRALIQYFSFLLDEGTEWDEMPLRQSQRPTYRFKRYLEALYRSGEDGLKASTSKGYMRAVVNFYRYYIKVGYRFSNPPFEHELITVDVSTDASSMKKTKRVEVHTTDLRLRIPSPQASDIPNRLISLTEHEWEELDVILRKDRRVIKYFDGELPIVTSLPLEFTLIFMLMRYTGLRREEAISITKELVVKPTKDQLKKGYINLTVGYFVGVKTKGGKDREIEIPTLLMKKLYEYSISNRYLSRLEKFQDKNNQRWTPLFINSQGSEFSLGTLNARWTDIRRVMKVKLGRDFNHKPHNLRATYAVSRLKTLIDNGLSQSDALTFIQNKLGHEDMGTTLHYLKQTSESLSAFQKAEEAYEYLFSIDDFEV